jgi:PIN domain nuclease of toxin-antitoxin system
VASDCAVSSLAHHARHGASNDPGNDVFLRVINGWEIQIKAQFGKLTLPKSLPVLLSQNDG